MPGIDTNFDANTAYEERVSGQTDNNLNALTEESATNADNLEGQEKIPSHHKMKKMKTNMQTIMLKVNRLQNNGKEFIVNKEVDADTNNEILQINDEEEFNNERIPLRQSNREDRTNIRYVDYLHSEWNREPTNGHEADESIVTGDIIARMNIFSQNTH